MCTGEPPDEIASSQCNCCYFLRNTEGMVPLPNSLDEANESLPALFENGLLNNNSLIMLEQIINQVWLFGINSLEQWYVFIGEKKLFTHVYFFCDSVFQPSWQEKSCQTVISTKKVFITGILLQMLAIRIIFDIFSNIPKMFEIMLLEQDCNIMFGAHVL